MRPAKDWVEINDYYFLNMAQGSGEGPRWSGWRPMDVVSGWGRSGTAVWGFQVLTARASARGDEVACGHEDDAEETGPEHFLAGQCVVGLLGTSLVAIDQVRHDLF